MSISKQCPECGNHHSMLEPCPVNFDELDLVQKYQVLSSVAAEARKIFDRALRELIEAERAAERAGCMIDEAQRTNG